MKNKEKILLYLDGQLTPSEMKKFELELQNSNSLRTEFESIKNNFQKVKILNQIELNDNYGLDIRSKLEQSKNIKTYFIPKFASALAAMVVLFVIFFNPYNTKNPSQSLIEVSESINNDAQINTIVNELSGKKEKVLIEDTSLADEELLNNIIAEEYLANSNDVEVLSVHDEAYDINNLDFLLTDEDKEVVYNEILNKEIIER